ncbi:MAG: hypothetical protein IKY82_05255 [Alistipes sp.]|nr:hypothetical protein [Alistipes sp.]
MKRFFIISLLMSCALCGSSCVAHRWVDVSKDVELDRLMQEKFPHLYDEYKAKELLVTKVEQREKDGVTIYRITHKDTSTDDDATEAMLWQNVYLPLLQ